MNQQGLHDFGAMPGPAARASAHGAEGFGIGVRLLAESFGMLRRERSLWGLALVPLAFSLGASALAVTLVYANAGFLYALIQDMLPVFEIGAWYQWIWLGPARLLIWLFGYLVFAGLAGLALLLSLMLASVAAAPFLDALSYRVEELVDGRVIESAGAGVAGLARDVGRSLASEARRMLFFLAIWAVLFGAGLLIPGAHLVTGPLMLAVTILFLPLEYGGHTLDRRQVPFRARRAWIMGNLPGMLGFGGAAFVSCFVPGVNLVMVPVLVVAGTLLVLRRPPSQGLA